MYSFGLHRINKHMIHGYIFQFVVTGIGTNINVTKLPTTKLPKKNKQTREQKSIYTVNSFELKTTYMVQSISNVYVA